MVKNNGVEASTVMQRTVNPPPLGARLVRSQDTPPSLCSCLYDTSLELSVTLLGDQVMNFKRRLVIGSKEHQTDRNPRQ